MPPKLRDDYEDLIETHLASNEDSNSAEGEEDASGPIKVGESGGEGQFHYYFSKDFKVSVTSADGEESGSLQGDNFSVWAFLARDGVGRRHGAGLRDAQAGVDLDGKKSKLGNFGSGVSAKVWRRWEYRGDIQLGPRSDSDNDGDDNDDGDEGDDDPEVFFKLSKGISRVLR